MTRPEKRRMEHGREGGARSEIAHTHTRNGRKKNGRGGWGNGRTFCKNHLRCCCTSVLGVAQLVRTCPTMGSWVLFWVNEKWLELPFQY